MAQIIDDFLTKEDCVQFIADQKSFTNNIKDHDGKRLDVGFQTLIDTKELSKKVFQRITEWALKQEGQIADDAKRWKLYHRIRLVHYSTGQGKALHRDTVFYDPETKTSSAYTCIIYLNDEFSGGRTLTYPNAGAYVNKFHFAGLEDQIRNTGEVAVVPKTGRSVIYPISLIHSGERVEGEKWLIIFKLQL